MDLGLYGTFYFTQVNRSKQQKNYLHYNLMTMYSKHLNGTQDKHLLNM